MLHRDLRPGNLLIGGDGRLHLTDFWLAVDGIEHSLGHSLMEDGSVYRAPEEVAGQPSSKSDIYSVGVLVVELVTGNAASQLRDAAGLLRWQNACRTLPLWLQHWLDASA